MRIHKALRLLLASAFVAVWPSSAFAVTHYLNAATVSALNQYIAWAEANPQDQYDITLTNAVNPYVLTKTIKITKGTVYIHGGSGTGLTDAHKYVLDGGYPNGSGFKRVFHVEGVAGSWVPYLLVDGVTVKGGYVTGVGAGIYLARGAVNVTDSYVQGNTSTQWGSGIYTGGETDLYVYNSVIRNNINFQATQNSCGGMTSTGGGLAVTGGNAAMYKTTVTGNQACRGAGISVQGGFFSMANSTISGNNANKRGGGLYVSGAPWVSIGLSTITQNRAGTHAADPSGFAELKYGGGLALVEFGGTLNFYGNILAKNEVVTSDKPTLFYHGHDCFDRFAAGVPARTVNYNQNFIGALANCTLLGFDSWPTIGWEGAPKDPLLGALTQKTGTMGPQFTHQPTSSSPVIGTYWRNGWGNTSDFNCTYDDQLGHRRDFYEPESFAPSQCDIGAHQYNWYH